MTNSPVGRTAREASHARANRSEEYRAEKKRLALFEDIARKVIARRAELQITQEELATRMSTSHSAISRIESGQHKTSVETLSKLASALELDLIVDFVPQEEIELV